MLFIVTDQELQYGFVSSQLPLEMYLKMQH